MEAPFSLLILAGSVSMSAMAFHEKAGRCQPVFLGDWDKFISYSI